MKKFITIIIASLAAMTLHAQDYIIMTYGNEIKANVVEIGLDFVKYTLADNENSPIITLSANEVSYIRLENGVVHRFSSSAPEIVTENVADSPVAPGMKYGEYKDFYDPHMYVKHYSDKYKPFWCGFASFFIPGLGELCEGEYLRGAAFLGGNFLLNCVLNYGFTEIDQNGTVYIKPGCEKAILFTCAASVALDIWSVCDAVRISKIKNMYYQDINGFGHNAIVRFDPNIEYVNAGPGNAFPTVGMALNITF